MKLSQVVSSAAPFTSSTPSLHSLHCDEGSWWLQYRSSLLHYPIHNNLSTAVTMLDPFPPIPLLSKAIQPFADYFHLTTLPLHIHEVLAAFLGYTFINVVFSPWISKKLFPVKYTKLSPERKLNWDVHVVSLCQSTMINTLALYVMMTDTERKDMNAVERVFGYTGASGMIQGLAAGYFLWDLFITLQNVKVFGYGMLAHALSALLVFSFGFVCLSLLFLGPHNKRMSTNKPCRDHLLTITVVLSSYTNSLPHS